MIGMVHRAPTVAGDPRRRILPSGAAAPVDGPGCPQEPAPVVVAGRRGAASVAAMREMITVREAGHELRVQVLDGRAYVAIVPVDGPDDPEAWTRAVSLPARRLYALVRAAWADDQYGTTGPLDPPLRLPDEPPDGPPEPLDDPFAEERARFGWRGRPEPTRAVTASGTSCRSRGSRRGARGAWGPPSWRPPRAARSGLPWSDEDDAALREAWLAADRTADRAELMRALAARFERTTGGVLNRLHRVGCDPTSPGVRPGPPGARDPRRDVSEDAPP